MDDDKRTIWCGNLSDKVTEDILYELFLQGGPLQRVNIPKDRDGKQRSFGFVTYKHVNSVPYAIELFDGTSLYNRAISLKSRNNIETPKLPTTEQNLPLNELIQLGSQMLLGDCMLPPQESLLNIYSQPFMHINQFLGSLPPYNEDRRSHRPRPYHREYERRINRHNNDHGHDSRKDHLSSLKDKRRDSHRSNRHENKRNY